jgi:hypothetical protein
MGNIRSWFKGDDVLDVQFTDNEPPTVMLWQYVKGQNAITSVEFDLKTAAEICDFIRENLPDD